MSECKATSAPINLLVEVRADVVRPGHSLTVYPERALRAQYLLLPDRGFAALLV